MEFIHYRPEPSRGETYCGRASAPASPLLYRVTCPDCLKPKSEIDYWIGHQAARQQMRRLLGKVDESKHAAVIAAYLLETIDEDDRDPAQDAGDAGN